MGKLQEMQEVRFHNYVAYTVIYRTMVMLYPAGIRMTFFNSFRPIASQQIPGINPASDLAISLRHKGPGYTRERTTSTPIIMCKTQLSTGPQDRPIH